MYSNILVPVVFDHGERSAQSIEVASHLLAEGGMEGVTLLGHPGNARALDGRDLELLHVMEEVPSYASTYLPAELAQQHQNEAMSHLQQMAKDVEASCDVAVIHGHASSSIMDFAARKGADCIVIASHKPGFEDYFLGSTAARVVRHAKCAVHVLR